MSEFGIHAPAEIVQAVRESENEIEERRREAFLAEKLFHDSHLEASLLSVEDRLRLYQLHDEFMEEKLGMNMGERFELALSDKYLGKIHVVELGKTTNPGNKGEIDGLKLDYHNLLNWMKAQSIVDDELPRSRGSRRLFFREPVRPDAIGKVMIVERHRRLIDTTITHNDQDVDILIAKRMLFSMPVQNFSALHTRDPKFSQESTIQLIENMLQHGSGGVKPIRTEYHLATKVVE